MQGVMTDVKEKAQNAAAKAEQKWDSAKASATEKTEKVMAADEPEREEAHARKHETEAEAYRLKDQKKAENRAEKDQNKQEAHDRAMQNAHMPNATEDHKPAFPTGRNPYVQTPVATTPTTIPHPHLTHEQITANAGSQEDQPYEGTNSVLPHDRVPQPTNASGFGDHENHQTHPGEFQQNDCQSQGN